MRTHTRHDVRDDLDRHNWYRIDNRNARGSETHVYIYNEIGYWGITADDFSMALEEVNSSRITLHINSPGGSVFDGVTIYNALRDHPARVDVYVDGVAASAASFIAMAGDTITMNRGSEMMIHNAHGLCVGNSSDMREMAGLLDRQNKKIAAIYQDRTGAPASHWLQAMEAESWYDAHEAVRAGLADQAVLDSDAEPEDRHATKPYNSQLPPFAYKGRGDAPPPKLWDPESTDNPAPPLSEEEARLVGAEPDPDVPIEVVHARPTNTHDSEPDPVHVARLRAQLNALRS